MREFGVVSMERKLSVGLWVGDQIMVRIEMILIVLRGVFLYVLFHVVIVYFFQRMIHRLAVMVARIMQNRDVPEQISR